MITSSIAAAQALIASGRTSQAVSLIETACAVGNVDALMLQATWRLLGSVIERDLAAARALLRRAVQIGHVDAALMEVALTANGSGGEPDWPGAVRLLQTAARHDPVAQEQLSLLAAMRLRPDGAPADLPSLRSLSVAPNVAHVEQLLSPAECAHVASVARPLLEPADVIEPTTGRKIVHPVRTSHSGAIGPAREDLVIRAINHRIAAVSNTQIDQGEPLTILHYAPGQQYRPHIDTLPRTDNQRIRTVLIYLNQGYGGGQTHFSANNLTIEAAAGDAIVFDNVLADGSPDLLSRHAGLPVTSGSKWLATRWIRAARYDPWAKP